MIADILIGVLYLMAARYVMHAYKLKLDLFQFGILAVAIQLFFDFAFYLLFTSKSPPPAVGKTARDPLFLVNHNGSCMWTFLIFLVMCVFPNNLQGKINLPSWSKAPDAQFPL